MSELSPTERASQEFLDVVMEDEAMRSKFALMIQETASREPVRDDFGWLVRAAQTPEDENTDRVSLHPVEPEDALRALLASNPSDSSRRQRPISGR